MSCRKRGEDIRAGDIIVSFGVPHLITTVEPYEHPTVPGACGIAKDADGWGISLWRGFFVEVAG